MPLLKGRSNNVMHSNFRELKKSGRSESQAWAISLSKAGKGKGKKVAKKVSKGKG